ncbi:MAG: glycosyltransferase, partial [Salinimicrobium sp.]
MRFTVFTNVQHKEREGKFYAYAPYIREMNIWLRHVEEVEVVAPLVTWGRVENEIKYIHGDLNFNRIPSFHFLGFFSAVKALVKIPFILYRIFGTMRKADHLHLRSPGNIGLLACICQIFFPGKPKSAKYAGNWDPSAKQPWSYRLQKWILSNTFLTRNMQVLVYGEWPGQSKNIVPFFTASFSEDEKEGVPKMAFLRSFKFLFVGNLVEGKRPLEAIRLVEELNGSMRRGLYTETGKSSARLEIYGEGPERRKLKNYVVDHKLEEVIIFKGIRPLEELKAAYQQAHFVLLLSRSEGWPKAIAEGMFFGCIPIA